MIGKRKSSKPSDTLKQFQLFVKRRNQKKNILHSENQPVNVKVKCFQELIKLNRKGNVITLPNCSYEDPHKCQSSKTIAETPPQLFDEAEDEQNELPFGKVNRISHEMKSWQVSKQTSKHNLSSKQLRRYQRGDKKQLTKTKTEQKQANLNYSTNIPRVSTQSRNENKKNNWFVEAPNKGEYFPIRKNNNKAYISNQLSTKRHQHQKSTPNLHITIKKEEFNGLRKQINFLENRAKECFGINFAPPQKERVQVLTTTAPEQHEFTKIISRTEARRAEENQYRQLMNEHMKQDSSIPSKFLGIIRTQEKLRPMTHEGWRRYLRI